MVLVACLARKLLRIRTDLIKHQIKEIKTFINI